MSKDQKSYPQPVENSAGGMARVSRRELLERVGMGFGGLALHQLLAGDTPLRAGAGAAIEKPHHEIGRAHV